MQNMTKMFNLLADQMKQSNENSNAQMNAVRHNFQDNVSKNLKCPKWPKNESFKSFKTNLQIWNRCSKSEGKYLELVEALHSSEGPLRSNRLN